MLLSSGTSCIGINRSSGVYRADNPVTTGENLGTQQTYGAWVRPNNHADWKCVIAKGGNTDSLENFFLFLNNSGPSPVALAGFSDGSDHRATGTTPISLVFPATLVVGTYDGATIRVYVNGRLDASTAYVGTPDVSNQNITVGCQQTGGASLYLFSGHIANAFVLNRALHQGEIMRLAAIGPDAFLIPDVLYPPLGPPPPAATPYRGWGSLPTPISQTNSGLHGPVIFPGTGPLDGVYH